MRLIPRFPPGSHKQPAALNRRAACLSFAWRALLCSLALLLLVACTNTFNANLGMVAAPQRITQGNADRGEEAFVAYGCGTCHTVAGIPGARGMVGPPLTCIGDRAYVAGRLENTPENLVHWIRQPQLVDPGNAMPDLGVTEQDAIDIAAYLYTARERTFWRRSC